MFNQAILLGRLGRDPEVRSTQSGTQVANFSLATSTGSNDDRKTEWHNIVCWAKMAEIAEKYGHKGDICQVVGEIRTRKWQDQSGKDRWTTEIHIGGFNSSLRFINFDQDQDHGAERGYDDDDEIPF